MSALYPATPTPTNTRHRLTVTGVVQGVGFRPFVYGLARQNQLTGFVGNNSGGVFIEIEGPLAALTHFHTCLVTSPPPLAHIEAITVETIAPRGETTFTIVHSQEHAAAHTLISPDISICSDCLREIFTPTDRRYRYPFTNCTNCGPRFTIIQDIPYDRPRTTMAPFAMCPACQAEYDNPLDRRFHAQPNACPICGPHLWLEPSAPFPHTAPYPTADAALRQTQHLLATGHIVAIKGIGGFHLACDATNGTAVAQLRQRKGRVEKPLAVMATNIATVHQFAELSAAEARLLTDKARPILLLRKKPGHYVSDLVAPGNQTIGVMLPYTPLHYLLLNPTGEPEGEDPGLVWVMTSANYSQEPIVQDNDAARQQLATLADAFLLHNREIHSRCDDSVLRVLAHTHPPSLMPIRRSRGYAPFPVKLPQAVPPLLAVGGELKATFCLAHERHAYLSQHIGDMENLETLEAFAAAVSHFQSIFRLQPVRIACDMHPAYLSTRWAQAQSLPVITIQHHHAHIASVMAENGLDGSQPVIGFSFDGTGYGPDGAIWGGEVLLADYRTYRRAAHLKYVPLAGGDIAIKRPYRLALAHLWAAGITWTQDLPPVAACSLTEQRTLMHQLETGLNAVPTSSMGRLFDAVAALIGVRQRVTYEGQAAIELEALAVAEGPTDYVFTREGEVIDAAAVIRAIVTDWQQGVNPALIAAKFHSAVAHLVVQISLHLREQMGLNQVALSGGVWQNVRLFEQTQRQLYEHHFDVFTHQFVPANDGGLALGQVMIAANQKEVWLFGNSGG